MTPRDSFWSQEHSVREGFVKIPKTGALHFAVFGLDNPGLAPPEDVCDFVFDPDRYRTVWF
jgi:hypothetical protein